MTLRPTPSTAPTELAWMVDAACRDYPVGWFFPDNGDGVRAACEVCERCPVRRDCLGYALRYRLNEGVWGGASERRRRRLLLGDLGVDDHPPVEAETMPGPSGA